MIPTTRRAAKRSSTILTDVIVIGMGVAAGIVAGAFVGVAGMVTGAILGGMLATVIARTWLREERKWAAHDRRLDQTIGVVGGSLGSPNLKHPLPTVGAYSTGSLGIGSSTEGESPAEGPMQNLD